jgi:hypothetical protein
VDGSVRRDLFDEASGRRAAEVETRPPMSSAHGAALTDEDRERMDERLKQLGYVE